MEYNELYVPASEIGSVLVSRYDHVSSAIGLLCEVRRLLEVFAMGDGLLSISIGGCFCFKFVGMKGGLRLWVASGSPRINTIGF